MGTKFFVEMRFFDDGQPPSAWERLPRSFNSARNAFKSGMRLETRNMANGVDCTIRVVNEAGEIQPDSL